MNDKILPHSIELEKAILGTILTDGNSMIEINEFLKPDVFYNSAHSKIFKSIQQLYTKDYPLDIYSVMADMQQHGTLQQCGGLTYLAELTNYSTFGIKRHSQIILQKYIQRELIRISYEISQEAYEDTTDVFELLDSANSHFLNIQNVITGTSITGLEPNKDKLLKKVLEVKTGMAKSDEVRTCLSFIKLYKNTVTVIGAKPGTGKTAFLLSSAQQNASDNYVILVLSLEMTAERLTARVIQSKTKIFAKRLVSGDITDDEYGKIRETELTSNILIDEGIGVNSQNLKTRLTTLYKKYKFDVLYIDYFQKIPLIGKDSAVNLQFNLMENQICSFAKEYSVAVCVLSQLTRGENSGLESLRGGGIEQGAQQVYIFTDEFQKEFKDVEFNKIPHDKRGRIKVSCEKNRDDSYMGGEIYFDKLSQTMIDWNFGNLEQSNEIDIF